MQFKAKSAIHSGFRCRRCARILLNTERVHCWLCAGLIGVYGGGDEQP